MKKNPIVLLLLLLLLCGCENEKSRKEIDPSLKQKIEKINADVETLKTVVDAFAVKTIKELADTDDGTKITFADDQTITILCDATATAPMIGVAEDNGIYYWTTPVSGNNQWLKDAAGEKIPVVSVDAAPKLDIDFDGYWVVNFADAEQSMRLLSASGQPILSTGKESDVVFRSVTSDDDVVVLTLADGTVLTVQKFKEIAINFPDGLDYTFEQSAKQEIAFAVTGTYAQDLTAAVSIAEDWTATVVLTQTEMGCGGVISVTAPAKEGLIELTLSISNATQIVGTAKLNFTVTGKPFVDLSKAGTANCYIVAAAGDYSFKATVCGNGVGTETDTGIVSPDIVIDEAMTADWLWMTKDGLVSDISLDKEAGKITFTVGEIEGNAVIGLLLNGEIVWSWHIWITDQPQSMTYANGKVFMDRNLGAIGTTVGGTDAYGMYYQWGRKDLFFGGTTTETSATAFAEATKNTIVNSAYTTLSWVQATGAALSTTSYAASHPMTFISMQVGSAYDWLAKPKKTMWASDKNLNDPCPQGYKVPDIDAWSDLSSGRQYIDGVSEWDGVNYGMRYTYNGQTTWYPAQGYRNRDKGNLVGLSTTRTGNYWSNAPAATTSRFFYFQKKLTTSSGSINSELDKDRAYGYIVRCCKE